MGRTHYNLGVALEQSGDRHSALASYRRAVALVPTMAAAYGRIAELALATGLRGEAALAFDQASRAAGDTLLGHVCLAKGRIVRGELTVAEEGLRALAVRDPASGEAEELLGHVLTETGRFDEAAPHLERAIVLLPKQVGGYVSLVGSKRLTEADRALLERVLARLSDRALPDRLRMALHFAAGKAMDDLGEHEGAMQQWDAANALRHRFASQDPSLAFDRDAFRQRIDRLIERFTPDFFEAHRGMGTPDETPVLVLGMPRSGTTLVERIVSSHPHAAGGGELPYWNERGPTWADADPTKLEGATSDLREGYERVLHDVAVLAHRPGALRVTDKMPFNFLWMGLVHLVFPGARFVHCRRNPVDTCLSIYGTSFATGWGFASDRGDLAFYTREYLRLMEHWRAVLPEGRLLDVDYESVTEDPEASARRLIAFTGLAWDRACLRPEKNPDAVRTASKWQARQPIYRTSVERWRSYEPWLGDLSGLL